MSLGRQIHKDPLKGKQEEVKISWLWLLLRLQFHLRMHHLSLDPNCKVKHKENGSKKMACDAELLPHDPDKRISITMHSMNYQGSLHRRSMLKGPCQPYHHYLLGKPPGVYSTKLRGTYKLYISHFKFCLRYTSLLFLTDTPLLTWYACILQKYHCRRYLTSPIDFVSKTCSCLHFTYPNFNPGNRDDFSFSPGSAISNNALQITPNTGNMSHRSGRVAYARETLKLWNSKRTALTSFSTEFVLNILPQKTDGAKTNRVVAVEFDTRQSYADEFDGNHFGFDFNSIKSFRQYPLSNQSIFLASGTDVRVSMAYNGTTGLFGVNLVQHSTIGVGQFESIGGSTGDFTQLNQIKSWNFTTIENDATVGIRVGIKVVLAIAALVIFSTCLVGVFFMWRRFTRQRRLANRNLEKMIDAHGPVKFKLRELRRATANFSPTRKLGRGGSGTVYLGHINRMNLEVAVKRVSTGNADSNRGEREFVAEVNTTSKLSHRNLVKLIGWCHEGSELLLVYEYFPMGSMDKLLYASARESNSSSEISTLELTWDRRYKIICGVTSALDYLHHGSSKRVLHRDVKPSNAVAGTCGYMAYECFFTGRASLDTDVYAFGVFIIKVVSGRSPSSGVKYIHDSDQVGKEDYSSGGLGQHPLTVHIVDWTWSLYGEGKVKEHAVPPCLVLVIDDNLYGLMVALSYI
uniref:non-specific serine/threonine protein kinase n=1 Tax=Aegilops tauschii TaxID=37682 RepID=M8B4T0_AEGTA